MNFYTKKIFPILILIMRFMAVFQSTDHNIYANKVYRIGSLEHNIIRDQLDIGDLNIKYILIKPANYSKNRSYPLFIFLHSLGMSPEDVLKKDISLLSKQNFYILIPQGIYPCDSGYSWYKIQESSRFAHGLETDENIVKSLLSEIKSHYSINGTKIYLSGFSQGGRLSFYIGLRNPNDFCEIIPIGGAYMDSMLDPFLEGALNLKISLFHGTKDEVNSFECIKQCYDKLKQRGMNISMVTYPLAHTYTRDVFKKILSHVS